jgi:hypothetical protein
MFVGAVSSSGGFVRRERQKIEMREEHAKKA